MTTVGIDLEQFISDPYATGIQRVLQQLAINWPDGETKAEFVVPNKRGSEPPSAWSISSRSSAS